MGFSVSLAIKRARSALVAMATRATLVIKATKTNQAVRANTATLVFWSAEVIERTIHNP